MDMKSKSMKYGKDKKKKMACGGKARKMKKGGIVKKGK